MTLIEINPRAVIGDNGGPSVIDDARDSHRVITIWLKNNPAVVNESDAYAANEILGIAKSSLTILETARDTECSPLHEAWKSARARWSMPIDSIAKLKGEVAIRLGAYMLAEEERREKEAAEARRLAAEAEAAAHEAERLEAEARQNASLGEFVDVVQASEDADQAFGDYRHAHRAAVIAEKSVPVRLKSRFDTKATKLKDHKKLVIVDVAKLLLAVGVTEKVEAALLTAARAYKASIGEWPEGVSEEVERGL